MIVRTVGDRLQLITQPDHARLAGGVMGHCAPLLTRARKDSILLAVAEHDNGWIEEDAAPRVNPATGQVFDFVTAPASVRQGVWPRGVARLSDDPWAAALVAQHSLVIYERYRPDSEWTPFFSEMEAVRDAMLRRGGLPLDDLLSDYVFVRLADLISLTFCTGWTDEQRCGDWRVQRFDTRVIVSPDAFAGSEIPVEIEAREIGNQPLWSDDELRNVLSSARTATLTGSVSGPVRA